jgi:peptidoglycan/xylan/chitin deacetylase (PgdA/CDA1 family)
LVRQGYTFISVDQLIEIFYHERPIPRGAVWISLDDGYRQWVSDLLPIIQRYKAPVTLFIPSGIISGDGQFPWRRQPAVGAALPAAEAGESVRDSLTVAELQHLADYEEVRLGGHTVTHALTVNCSPEELRFEIGGCKRSLEFWTGRSIQAFSYPEGRFDGREGQFLREFGFELAATTEVAFATRNTDPLRVPRFCVPDDVTFPEAICAMAGVWRPFIDPIKKLLPRPLGGSLSPSYGGTASASPGVHSEQQECTH